MVSAKAHFLYRFSICTISLLLFTLSSTTEAAPSSQRHALVPRVRGLTAQAKLPSQNVTVKYDARLIKAANIAKSKARSHSIKRCWRFVKRALLEAEVIDYYPKTVYAKQAAKELPNNFGFARIPVSDPFDAPIGAVLVYGGRGAGHVEIRTKEGFVSDFSSNTPSKRPLIGVFVKPASM